MSIIALAGRSGTDVEPTCEMEMSWFGASCVLCVVIAGGPRAVMMRDSKTL